MPCSSPRSSGWRATDWIIDAKMLPMPTPAPRAPRPTPSARPMALPALVTSPLVAAITVPTTFPPFNGCTGEAGTAFHDGIASDASVLRLDRRADVDGGQGGKDERLDPDDDDHLEEVEDRRDGQHERGQEDALEDEHQPDEGEDQDVPREHVGKESDAQREQAHELADDLERDDQREQRLRCLGDPALEVADRAVPADSLHVREHEREESEGERHRERGGGRVDAPDRDAV